MMERAQRLAREGRRILNMEVGEPDFATPRHIREAALRAMEEGFTHYTSSRGIPELREAICEDLRKRGVEADPGAEILVTPGAKHAIYCACLATLNPGDRVLVLAPAWPSFYTCIQAAEAEPVEVPTGEGYGLDEEGLKERLTGRTTMVLVNSPNNPTGGALTKVEVKAVADLAVDHDLLVLSDEIYDRIVYDGFRPLSMASLDGMWERTITINGLSKTYAMTGWRLGYAAASREIIEAMTRVQQTSTTCPASFAQRAGVEALRGPQDCVDQMVREYDERRRAIVERLRRIPGVKCAMPRGAFYVFPDFSALGMPSEELAGRMLEEAGVSATAGTVFGDSGEGHIRFSYATSLPTILEAMEKLESFVEGLKKG